MPGAITVVCPQCNNRMRAAAEHVGRQGRCPACKALVPIQPTGEESLESIHPASTATLQREVDPRLSSTSVSGWLSGLVGAGVAAALYLAVFLPLYQTRLGQLFLNRGLMPYFITLVTCWAAVMLVLKYAAVKKQMSFVARELELIPLEIGVEITPDNAGQFTDHVARLPREQRLSILGRRIQGALEHFKSRGSVPEVQQYLATQAEIDASGVDAGYTLLRAFIWAVPILGFIGTVVGISGAVSGLNTSLAGAAPDALTTGLQTVTVGLATAFDTTLIALVMAILLLFPTESLRKSEYEMLDRIETFANEVLLRRMADDRPSLAAEDLPEVVRRVLESAFREHQRWLAQWQTQVGRLGQIIGADFESAVGRVLGPLREAEADRWEKYEGLSRVLGEIFEKAERSAARRHQLDEEADSAVRELIGAAGKLERALLEHSSAGPESFPVPSAEEPGPKPQTVPPESHAAEMPSAAGDMELIEPEPDPTVPPPSSRKPAAET